MSGKAGLIAVKRMVVRNGKTFQQTVYVKAKHESKVQHGKSIQVPDWKFHNEKEFQDEVARINDIKDRSERTVLKEQLLDHLENDLKVKWDKVPDTDPKAFVKNTLRAFSAAKKHLQANPTAKTTPQPQSQAQPTQPTQPSQPAPSTGGGNGTVVTKQPGSSYIMDRDTSKKMARDFRDKHGMDKTVQMLKDAGIKWDEVADKGPNNMRALRALASFMRKGGELGTGQNAPQQTPNQPQVVLNQPNQPLQTQPQSKFEKDSIQYDYEQAPARHKFIGLATGVMPLDDKTADYLETLIKEGKFGLLDSEGEDFKLPKKLDEFVQRNLVDQFTRKGQYNALNQISDWGYNRPFVADMFKGTPYEAEYNNYVKNREDFKNKWSGKYQYSNGVDELENSEKLVDVLESIDKGWQDKTGVDFLESLGNHLTGSLSDAQANELWDRFDIDSFLKYSGKSGVLKNMAEMSSDSGLSGNIADVAVLKAIGAGTSGWASPSNYNAFKSGIANGTIKKSDVIYELGKQLRGVRAMKGSKDTMLQSLTSSWRVDDVDFLRNLAKDAVNGGKSLDIGEMKKMKNEILSDLAPMKTPEADHIAANIVFRNEMENFFSNNRSVKPPEKFEPISMDDWASTRSMESIVKVHIGALRTKTEKARKKYLDEFKNKKTADFAGAYKNGTDPSKLTFPGADEIKDIVKTTLQTAPDDEAKRVADKVANTHDKQNHGSFTTKVHGVYRVKRIASEEKFQKINQDINNTGFYYHGTSFDTAQKILGLTGGFKVFTAKDSGKIKAGSMLGYGIYLATQSSKSMQYVGNGFRSGARGVLFVCKASLGNAVHTTARGCGANQPIMARPTTDSVWMDKPHVINPEWAVKRAEQAVPRLWIDAERVQK